MQKTKQHLITKVSYKFFSSRIKRNEISPRRFQTEFCPSWYSTGFQSACKKSNDPWTQNRSCCKSYSRTARNLIMRVVGHITPLLINK